MENKCNTSQVTKSNTIYIACIQRRLSLPRVCDQIKCKTLQVAKSLFFVSCLFLRRSAAAKSLCLDQMQEIPTRQILIFCILPLSKAECGCQEFVTRSNARHCKFPNPPQVRRTPSDARAVTFKRFSPSSIYSSI